MNIDHRGSATIRRRSDGITSIISVSVRLEHGKFGAGSQFEKGVIVYSENGEFAIRSQFERPVVLQPTPECLRLYPRSEALFRCCEGSAASGVFYATRDFHDQCSCVVFTRFDGAQLPPDCGMGFATAAALACFYALEQPERARQMNMEGWEEI